VSAHKAIPAALDRAAAESGFSVNWTWVHTSSCADTVEDLGDFRAIWCVPASPYANTAGAVAAIRFARETRRPFLGTCGGFQHALLEYAEAAWGLDAIHAESNANGDNPVIAPLMCALVDVKGALHFASGSRLAAIYGTATATEEYHCSFGLNPI